MINPKFKEHVVKLYYPAPNVEENFAALVAHRTIRIVSDNELVLETSPADFAAHHEAWKGLSVSFGYRPSNPKTTLTWRDEG